MVRQLAIVDPYSPAPRQISAAAEVRGALAVCALLEAPSRPWHVIHVPTGLVISRHRAYAAAWPAASWYMALAAELGLDLAAITSVDDPARAHFQAAMIAREPPDGTRWAAAPGPHGAQRTTVRASDEEASVTTQMIDLDSYHVLLDGAGEDIGARQIAATALACAAGRAWIERSADDTTIRDALAAAGAAFEQLAGLAEAAPSAAFDAMLCLSAAIVPDCEARVRALDALRARADGQARAEDWAAAALRGDWADIASSLRPAAVPDPDDLFAPQAGRWVAEAVWQMGQDRPGITPQRPALDARQTNYAWRQVADASAPFATSWPGQRANLLFRVLKIDPNDFAEGGAQERRLGHLGWAVERSGEVWLAVHRERDLRIAAAHWRARKEVLQAIAYAYARPLVWLSEHGWTLRQIGADRRFWEASHPTYGETPRVLDLERCIADARAMQAGQEPPSRARRKRRAERIAS